MESAYDVSGIDQTVFIVRSNKRAYLFNKQIRQSILILKMTYHWRSTYGFKNNYFWLPQSSKPGFIANGDIIEIIKIKSKKEIYGFFFC